MRGERSEQYLARAAVRRGRHLRIEERSSARERREHERALEGRYERKAS